MVAPGCGQRTTGYCGNPWLFSSSGLFFRLKKNKNLSPTLLVIDVIFVRQLHILRNYDFNSAGDRRALDPPTLRALVRHPSGADQHLADGAAGAASAAGGLPIHRFEGEDFVKLEDFVCSQTN